MNSINVIKKILSHASDGKHSSLLNAINRLEQADLTWVGTASIRVLRNYTLEPIEPFIKLAGYKLGLKINLSFSDYDNYQQEVVDISSELHKSPPDLVAVALCLDNLAIAFDKDGRFRSDTVLDHIIGLVSQLKQQITSHIAINTFLPPVHYTSSWRGWSGLAMLNQQLKDLADKDERLLLVDFDRLVACVGIKQTFDPRYWFLYKSPLKIEFLQLWGDVLAQAVASVKGLAKKVLVLDCDNTLWGGIIGEDGMNGIKLSANDYPGNVYQVFHKQLLELQQNGVLLALCSKNNEADVMAVLDTHPDCLIRRPHLVTWRINWENKIDNLQAIAQELNLSLDSFLFIDDSPVENEQIREILPMVDVLQVPQRIYELPNLLQQYKGFNKLVTTVEDNYRTALYQAERDRHNTATQYYDINSFLSSLQLESEIGQAKPDELLRVAQLTQKTNQFNLTTRRYVLGGIEALSSSNNHLVLVMRVADKYGDYGLTGVAIVANQGETCHIDSFLMSCRILGRKLEDVFLVELLKILYDKWGEMKISAEYIETPKNSQVSDFFEKRGFTCVTNEDKIRFYIASPPLSINYADYIKVKRR